MQKLVPYVAGFALFLGLTQITQAVPITVGSFDSSRTSLPFDGGAFDEARALLLANFDSINDVAYPTIPNQPQVDLLFLTNAGMTTPLSSQEQLGLLNFVNGGGTLLLSAFGDGTGGVADMTAASLLAPFSASSTGMPNSATTFYPTIPNAPSPIFDGVTSFANTNASGLQVTIDAIAVASGGSGLGPVLYYYPTIPNQPTPRFGEIIVYSNEDAFRDSADGGQFRNNRQLFLNVANSAAARSVPEPATILLVAVGMTMCARRKAAIRVTL